MTQRVLMLGVSLIALIAAVSCDTRDRAADTAAELTGADAVVGQEKIAYYGCASCHTIPGIKGADSLVGPPLDHVGSRAYIGGVVENTPQNLVMWIQDPPSIAPHTAMPNVRVTEADARSIASYLYTLK